MKTITAKFIIVTPMFIGDANQKSSSVRPSSIKGALRFWWRALAWKSTFENAKNDAVQALRDLHTDEARIFGSAVEDQKGGQGIFLLSIDNSDIDRSTFTPKMGHQYLLGQGLFKPGRNGGLERTPLGTGSFTLKVLFKPKSKIEDQRSLAKAILLWGLLGGLGSRARKGFGSVAIQSWETAGIDLANLKIPQNTSELQKTLNDLVGNLANSLPPLTAFSQETRIDVSKTGKNALNLLDLIGQDVQLYRNSGRRRGQTIEREARNFRGDADIVRAVAQGQSVREHPERVAFGLPHNYHFKDVPKSETDVGIEPNGEKRSRRASPLFIHIHQFPGGECCAIQTLLPAVFLPKGDEIEMKAQRNTQRVVPNIDWSVITDYLDRFSKNSDYKQVIP